MTTMPNLPVIPDLALFTTEVNRSSLTQADTSCALTSELAIEQAFGDILATLSTSTHEESDLPNPDSGTETNTIDNQEPKFVDPLTVSVIPIPIDQWINPPQPIPDISATELLSTSPRNTILNANQPITEKPIIFTETENNLLPIDATNENRLISNTTLTSPNNADQTIDLAPLIADQKIQPPSAVTTIWVHANSTTEQSNTDKTAILTQDSSLPFEQQSSRNRDINNIAPLSANHVNQAADAANFTDNGKILPSSTTFVATTYPKLNLSIDIANATASNTSTIIASSSPKPKFVDPLTINMLPTSADQWVNQPQSVLDNSIGTVDTLMNNTPAITTEFGQPNWSDEFGQKITWLATQRIQTAELKLHPAHLGPIEISLQLSGDKQLTAQFISHHAVVRETIEANLPKLREIMATNGITLSDASVSADTPQQQAGNGRGDSAHTTRNYYFSSALSSPISMHTSTLLITGQHSGIIDTFA